MDEAGRQQTRKSQGKGVSDPVGSWQFTVGSVQSAVCSQKWAVGSLQFSVGSQLKTVD